MTTAIKIIKDDRSRVVQVASMSRKFHEEVKEKGPFDPSRVSMFLSSVCNSDDAAMFVAIDKFAQPAGFLVCQFGQNYLTGEFIAEETGLFVLPECRSTKAGRLLVAEFEDWAKSKRATRIRVTVQASTRYEATERYWLRQGYERSELSMTKEVKH